MKKIVLTGGGTAGHVTANIALIPSLKNLNYDIAYIGSYKGIEKRLISNEKIPYYSIFTGKLRRYFDLKNFTDPFRVIKGYFDAKKHLKSYKPDVIFSKGGFVSVPVVLAARSLKIPIILHESDITPGLANRICFPFASKICCNFPETIDHLPKNKSVLTGSPIRQELLHGSILDGQSLTAFKKELPVLLIIGGSLGSVIVNKAVRATLPELLKQFNIIHICGKGNLDASLTSLEGYNQYEYVTDELKDLFAYADIILSRAGANSICEILALKKPNVLIPLSAAASRGDQILNARSYESLGYSFVLTEEQLNPETLLNAITKTYNNKQQYIDKMTSSTQSDGVASVINIIKNLTL